jgi:hypothetical protein
LKDDDHSFAGVYSNGNSGRPVNLASVTDGTSNTAMLSETLIGSGPAANQVTLGGTKRRTTYLFPTSVNAPPDQGVNGAKSAMDLVAQCKSLPGSTQAFGSLAPPNGNVWIAGNPGSCMLWDAYNHFMPPKQHRLRQPERREHRRLCRVARRIPAQQQPPRRR